LPGRCSLPASTTTVSPSILHSLCAEGTTEAGRGPVFRRAW
jgi:hypothetical protein